jgi:hypothetical protein
VGIIIFIYAVVLAGKVAYDLSHRAASGLEPAAPKPTLSSASGKPSCPPLRDGERGLLAGEGQQFFSADHPRALGLNFCLRYPQGWRQQPPEGSRALVRFASDQGKGREAVILLVVPDPPRSPLISERFRQDLFNGILAGYRCKYCAVSSRPIRIAGKEVVAVSFEDFTKDAHIKVTNYLFPVGHRMITIQGRVESPRRDGELEARFHRYTPLFDRIAQSLTLN